MSAMLYFPEVSAAFKQLLAATTGRRIAVVGHARPDGDCIGSQVSLARALRARGLEVICVNADAVPRRLEFLAHDLKFVAVDQLPAGDWAAIYVDCADHARAGEKALARFPRPLGNIDHHLSNNGYAEHNIVVPTAAAACEILAALLLENDLAVDAATAQALFVGLMTDTGQFRFQSTTQRTFALAGELVARGAKPAECGYELYERESPGKIQLLQRFLASLRMECGGRVCIGTLPNGIFAETNTSAEDTEGLVDYARSIDGVEIGVLVEDRGTAIKASLRSKLPLYRVDQVAARFGGGGHACAAGLNLKTTPVAEFLPQLISALEQRLREIDATAAAQAK